MDCAPQPSISVDSYDTFPDDVTAVTDRQLETLHTRLCHAIDFEYFFEGISHPVTRLRYRLVNDEMHRRESTRELNAAAR